MKTTDATEQRIALNLLTSWDKNPRKSRDDNDVAQMANSLNKLGQQSPLIVHKAAGETLYKVIEGETRRCGFAQLATENKIAIDAEVICWVAPEDATDDQLLAIALASNTIRRQMNPIEEMEAFNELARAGMKLRAIADAFGVEPRVIRQRLALGDLIEDARNLVRTGARQMGWASALTLASPKAQERIVAEIAANPSAFPDAASVRAEVSRTHIPASSALFPVTDLSNCLVTDLFSEENGHANDFFSDVDAFWARQREEIAKLNAQLAATHREVRQFDRVRFNDAGWTRGGEPAESVAVIVIYDDGSVKVEEGLMPPAVENFLDGEGDFLMDGDATFAAEHEAETSAVAAADTGDVTPIVINPLANATKDTSDYLVSQMTAETKLAIAGNARFAMAAVIAASLTRRGPVSQMSPSGVSLDRDEQTSQAFQQVHARRTARDRIVLDAGISTMNSPAEVIQKVLALAPNLLEDLFAYTVADAATAVLNDDSFEILEAFGQQAFSGWDMEPAYLSTLSTPQVRALAGEMIPVDSQPNPRAARSVVENAILAENANAALQGNFVGATTWLPPQIVGIQASVGAKRDAQASATTDADGDDIAQAA